jgi:hypothetical protein
MRATRSLSSRGILGPMHPGVSLVLVEGLPGSGKTTTSQQIAAEYRERGTRCVWEREEARDHPVFGPDVRRLHRQLDYDEICLAQWRRLVDVAGQTRWVLDGCAMQSTARFMFEQNWAIDRIESYWRRFEQTIRRVRAVLVYFTHPRPNEFIHRHTIPARGSDWPNIARYVEQTPAGQQLAAAGLDAPVEFWVRYGHMCDLLVEGTALPVLRIDTSNGWHAVSTRAIAWIDKLDSDCDE